MAAAMILLLTIYISVATNMVSGISASSISLLSTSAASIIISNKEAYESHSRHPWTKSVGDYPCYRVEGGDYGLNTTTTSSTSIYNSSSNTLGLKSMAVDYKYVLRIISPSPPDDGGVDIVGVVGEGTTLL